MKTLLFTCLWLLSISAITQTLNNNQINQIDKAIIDEMKFSSAPGVALCIINNGKVVYQKPFGIANVGTNTPVTDSTIFEIASVTKVFTSLALLSALEKAGLDENSPVGSVVKGLSPKLSAVTFGQLLSHTSGVMDYFPNANECKDDMNLYFKSVGDQALFAEPGKVFSYSNNGFALAGLALATLTKTTFANAIDQLVLKPLQLNNTAINLFKVAYKPLAAGHIVNPQTHEATPYLSDMSYARMQPAGGLFSNIKDLSDFALAILGKGTLNNKRVFSDTIINKMVSKHANTFSAPASYLSYLAYPNPSYGYGLMRFQYNHLNFIGHAGEANTQNAMFYMVPDKKFAVIMLSNRGFYLFMNSFKKIVEVVLNEKELQVKAIKKDPALYKKLVGKYVVPSVAGSPQEWSEIFEKNGELFMKTEDNKEYQLEQVDELTFRFTNPLFLAPMEIAFYKDDLGNIPYLNFFMRTRVKVL